VTIPIDIERRVRRRAKGRCEYCRLPESAYALSFEIDHVLASQHGGKTRLGNLAWACPWCNRSKGPNLAGYDYKFRRIVPLYNPRREHWNEHFRWVGPRLVGSTATGRATIRTLNINRPAALALRRELLIEGLLSDDESP
jgi:HNH endonuclease